MAAFSLLKRTDTFRKSSPCKKCTNTNPDAPPCIERPTDCPLCRVGTGRGVNYIILPLNGSYFDGDEATANHRRINRALQTSTNLPGIPSDDARVLDETAGLAYKGFNPAIKFDLMPRDDEWSQCVHTDQRFLAGSPYEVFFANQKAWRELNATHLPVPDHIPDPHVPRWEAPRYVGDTLLSTVSQVVFSGRNEGETDVAVGVMELEFNMTEFARSINNFDDAYQGVPISFSVVIDNKGTVIIASDNGKQGLFHKGVTDREMREPRAYSIIDDVKLAQNSGIDLSQPLYELFENNTDGAVKCGLEEVPTMEIIFPKTNITYLVGYCRFVGVPKWGLIVGMDLPYLEKAAGINIILGKNEISQKEGNIPEVVMEIKQDDEEPTESFTINNYGLFPFPFQINGSKWMSFEPTAGLLPPGGNLSVKVKVQEGMSDGEHDGGIWVSPRTKEKDTSYSFCYPPKRLRFTVNVEGVGWGAWARKHAIKFALGFVFIVVLILIRLAWQKVKSQMETAAMWKMKVHEAVDSTKQLAFPMVLMPASTFKSKGKLVIHEEAVENNYIIWLNTLDAITEFCQKSIILFISHQWTSFTLPDHTLKQYAAILEAVASISRQKGWKEEDVYIWADYTCIPQAHRGLQKLAIYSLTVYASNAAAFLICAPPVDHDNLEGVVCDKESYQRRCWCRAEQMSHFLACGKSQMYLAEGDKLLSLSDEWLSDAMYVFHAELTCCRLKHKGMASCDKEFLMIPMLGLWAQLRKNKENPKYAQAYSRIAHKIHELFPERFDYVTESGTTNKELFSNLLTLVEEMQEDEKDENMPDK